MTTIDLRMELAREIEFIPDSEQLLLKVINYVRGITKKENPSVTLTGDALRLWNRTEELAALPSGWDGSDATPIEKRTVQNVKNLIRAGVSSDFKGWVIFPDDNGTLLLQSREGDASISIGNNSYSFVSTKGGKTVVKESVRFSPKSVLTALRSIVTT